MQQQPPRRDGGHCYHPLLQMQLSGLGASSRRRGEKQDSEAGEGLRTPGRVRWPYLLPQGSHPGWSARFIPSCLCPGIHLGSRWTKEFPRVTVPSPPCPPFHCTNVLTPFPRWSCDFNDKSGSGTCNVTRDCSLEDTSFSQLQTEPQPPPGASASSSCQVLELCFFVTSGRSQAGGQLPPCLSPSQGLGPAHWLGAPQAWTGSSRPLPSYHRDLRDPDSS